MVASFNTKRFDFLTYWKSNHMNCNKTTYWNTMWLIGTFKMHWKWLRHVKLVDTNADIIKINCNADLFLKKRWRVSFKNHSFGTVQFDNSANVFVMSQLSLPDWIKSNCMFVRHPSILSEITQKIGKHTT